MQYRIHRRPPPAEDIQDLYNSTSTYITPIRGNMAHCSYTSSISSLRVALSELYKARYGDDPIRCLVTGVSDALNVAHGIMRATKSPDVACFLSYPDYLMDFTDHTLRVLPCWKISKILYDQFYSYAACYGISPLQRQT